MSRFKVVHGPRIYRFALFRVLRRAPALAALAASLLWFASAVSAQNTINWVGGTGQWDNVSLWSTGTVPDSNTDLVTIGNASSGNVTLDINATIGDLILTSGNILQIISNNALTVQAGVGTNGTVTINSGGALAIATGGTVATTAAFLINSSGSLQATGGTLIVDGALTNAGTADLGTNTGTSAVTASADSLNNTGTLNLAGNISSPTLVTTLNISGAASNGSSANLSLVGSSGLTIGGDFSNAGTLNVDNNPSAATGGSSLTVAGTLENSSSVNIGSTNGNISGAATASAGALINSGTLSVHGDITGATNVPASLTITGAAFTSGIPTEAFPAVNSGTINVQSGASLSIAGNYGNFVTTNVDTTSDFSGGKSYSGGSTLNVSGVISNSGTSLSIGSANPQNSGLVTLSIGGTNGTLNLGNSSLTQPTEIIAAGLNNLGTVNITGTPTVQALLDLTGAASANPFVQPPAVLNAGTYNLTNDAELEYTGPGINGIGIDVAVSLNGAGASITATNLAPNTGSGVNSALNTFGGSAGTFEISNGAAVSTDGSLNFLNMGTTGVDQSGSGGSSFSVGGTLENGPGATMSIGNALITKPTTVTSASLNNYGTLNITGSATTQSLLDVTAQRSANPFLPASGVLGSGTYNLTNDAELEYLGPGISAIGPGVTVNLNGANASINATNLAPNTGSGTNSALNTLASNAGTFELSNAGSVSTNTGTNFTNSGTMDVDLGGQGGSTLSIGGALANTNGGEILIGTTSIQKPSTVTLNGPLVNAASGYSPSPFIPAGGGLIELSGAANVQTTLNVTGAAPNTLTGIVELGGDSLLEFGSGGITSIAGAVGGNYNGSLLLSGTNARVGLAGNTSSSSALAGLSLNGGSLVLANGATVTTGVNFVNSGTIGVDNGGAGGSTLNIGGTIENTPDGGSLLVGGGSTTASSTFAAAGFALNTLAGTVSIEGSNPSSGAKAAALTLASGIASIAYQGSLTLSNSNSYVALSGTSPLSNNGLSTLTSNAGTLTLQDGASVTTNATFTLTNAGNGASVNVDAAALDSGSTTLNIGGLLNNDAALNISNLGTTGSSTAAVTAAGLNNAGNITLDGATANHTATLTVNGTFVSSGNVHVGTGNSFETLTVTGNNFYIQNAASNAGQTTVTGTLTASGVIVNSGVVQGTGTINAPILNSGAVEGGISTTPGGLAVTGNYSQAADGALYQIVDGTTNGQFSSLNVHGNATLAGFLDVGGYGSFALGQTYDILNITSTNGTISGAFSGIEYNGQLASGSVLNIGGGLALDLAYNGNNVLLDVVSSTPSATADIWNAGAGTWSATNMPAWSAGAIPSSISDAILGDVNSPTSGTVTLDASASPITANSLTVTNGYTLSFGAANESLTTNAGVNIDAGGEIDLENSGDALATGHGGSNGNLTNFGTLNVENGAALSVGGGGVLTNAGTLNVQNGSTLALAGDFINGLPGNTFSTSATANFEAAGTSTISGDVTNNEVGTLNIDDQFTYVNFQAVGGGTTLAIGGTLTNAGNLTIGNSQISSPTTVNVAGDFLNTGTLDIVGASTALFGSTANVPALLNISGNWLPSSGALDTAGYYSLVGDAQMQYSGPGIGSIGSGVYLSLDGANASLSTTSLKANTNLGTNSALNTLTNNYGDISLADGAQVQTNAGLNLTNNGLLEVDATGHGLGGSTLTIGGMLINNASFEIGPDLTATATVNAAGFINNGQIQIDGCNYAGCTGQALLNVTGPAGSFIPTSGLLGQGFYSLGGDAEIAYSGPGINTIGTGVEIQLSGPNASIEATNLLPNNGSTNSALNTLANNAGLLGLIEGVSVATNAGLNLINTGEIQMSGAATTFGNPATTLTVGGTLVNSGIIQMAAGSLSSVTLTAAGLSNNGSVYITGYSTFNTSALLDITGVAAANPFVSASGALSPGSYTILDNGELEYTGPGISTIPNGAALSLSGPTASITATSLTPLTASGVNSALNTLTVNSGNLLLDNTQVSTTGDLLNTGGISEASNGEYNNSIPAGTLNIGGTLTNTSITSGACGAANAGICVASGATLSAAGLVNSGTIGVSGGASGTAPSSFGPATMSLSGPASNSGTLEVNAGAQFTATGAFTNLDTGTLSIAAGAGTAPGTTSNVTAAGFNNSGTVAIGNTTQDQGNLTVTGSGNSYTQTGALALTTVLGVLNAPTVNVNGGVLRGNGTIIGNVVNGATMAAINPQVYSVGCNCDSGPGLLTINGNYTQTSGGVLNELIQGPVKAGSDFSAINISGSVTLSGALDVTTLNFQLSANQSFDLMNFAPGTLTGAFTALDYNNLATSNNASSPLNIGGGLALSVVYNDSSGAVLLDVVPLLGPSSNDNWVGNSDVWSNPVDWSSGAAPTPTQDVYVGTGSGGTVTFDEPSTTVNNLTIQPGATVYTLVIGGGNSLMATTTITNSSQLVLQAAGALLTSGGNFTNNTTMAIRNGAAVVVGSKSAPANFINTGDVEIDAGRALTNFSLNPLTGAGSLTVSGTLNDAGQILIGDEEAIPGATTEGIVSAASLSATSGMTTLANTLAGHVLIGGENQGLGSAPAVLQLGTSINSITSTGLLSLENGNSFITTDTSNFTNDGISGLTSNAGVLSLGSGSVATINGTLNNSGTISLATTYENYATSAYEDIATTLNVGGLNDTGSVQLDGCSTAGCTAQALLNITGAAGSFIPTGGALSAGNYYLTGNSEIAYTGSGISSIAQSVNITLVGSNASITDTSLTPNNSSTNSAFNTLANNAGSLDVGNGASIATNRGLNLTNTGLIEISSSSGQAVSGMTIGGVLNNQAGSITNGLPGVSVGPGATLTASGLVNSGVLFAGSGASGTFTINGTADNSGELSIGGTTQISGLLTNEAGGIVDIGQYTAQGQVVGLGPGNLAVGGLNNAGEVDIYAVSTGISTGSLAVTGGSYTQTGAAATTLVEGNLTAPSININGGLLEGNGLITGNVTNSAVIAAATNSTTAGLLTIAGNYSQTSTAAWNEIVSGPSTRGTQFGAIDVSGAATLAGALSVSAASGFAFAGNESFDILNLAPNGLSGTFDTLTYNGASTSGTGLLNLGGNLALALAYDGSNGEVLLDVVTPDNWTAASGNWSAGASWSGGIPGTTQLVNIGTGTGGTVTLDQSASIYNLNVEPGSTSGYTLAFNPSETLKTAGTVNIGTGSEIDLENSGATLQTGGDFTSAGTLHLEDGGVVNVGAAAELRNFNNTGTILVDTLSTGGSSLNISGTLSNTGGQISVGGPGLQAVSTLSAESFAGNALTGTVEVQGSAAGGTATATIELQNGITSIVPDADLLLWNNNSQVDLNGAFGNNSALTGLTNVAGTLQLESGSSLSTTGDLTVASTGSLGVDEYLFTGGNSSLIVNGTLYNAGTFAMGSGGFGLGGGLSIASAVITSGFNNSGTAQIGGGYSNGVTLTINGSASNSGIVNIVGGAEINVTGSNAYTQTAGTTTVNGILISSQPVLLNGGTLQGSGYIGADVSNVSGTVLGSANGSQPGTLSIGGSYNQGVGGTLNEIVGGTSAGQFSALSAAQSAGSVNLAGALNISSINNFQFQVGQSFDIINSPANSLSGTFTTLEFDCSGSGMNCMTDTTPVNGTPLVIDENGTQIGFVVDYEDANGVVLLEVETPPPTAVSWTGTTGAWSDTSAWSDSLMPLGYQDITIGGTAGGTGGTLTYDQTSSSIDSLTIGAGSRSGYSLTFNANTALRTAKTVTINSGGAIEVVTAGASLATGGDVTNAGVLNVADGGSLTVGSASAPADLSNSGTMEVDGGLATGGGSATVYGTVNNSGTLVIGTTGLASLTGMTAGGLVNSGILVMTGSSAANAASLTVNGNATNILEANIGSFSHLTVTGSGNSYTQNCPGQLCLATTTVNGTLTAPAVNINAGVLQGVGTINGNVTNSGVVTGGSFTSLTPGTLTINGSYTQTSAGMLQETVVGTGAPGTAFSAIDVTGSVSLNGILQISTASSFAFAFGQTFDMLNFTPGNLSGTFATVDYGLSSSSGNGVVSIGNNLDLSLSYNNVGGQLVLQVGTLDTWIGTTDVWTGSNDATNWSTGVKPSSTDDVLVGGGTGGTVTHNEASDTVLSLTVQAGTTSAYDVAFGVNDGLEVIDTVSINTGAAIEVEANGAALVVGGNFSNAGTLTLGQSTTSGQGGTAGQGAVVQIGTPGAVANLTNTGSINVDPASTPVLGATPPTGGSSLIVSGQLDNSGGTLNIGNTGITSQSVVSAASLDATSGTSTQANTLDGTITITGQDPSAGATAALLKLGAGITNIAATGSLTLANSNSFLTLDTSSYTNDALSSLTTNAGTLTLDGGSAVAVTGSVTNSGTFNLEASTATIATGLSNPGTLNLADGSSMTVGPTQTANLTNSSQISVDLQGSGGSTLKVNGTIDNTNGVISIGNATMTSASILSADGFTSNSLAGSVIIYGNPGAPSTLLLGSGINTISGELALLSANAFVNVNSAPQNNSGLSGLTTVTGSLVVDSGASVVDSGALTISSAGAVVVDDGLLSAGGSSLTLHGALNNTGTFSAGIGGSAATTVSATGLNNTGGIVLGGGPSVTFTVSGAANNSGTVNIASTGTLNVTGGVAYTQAAGSTTIAGGGNLNAAFYTQSGGTTTVNGILTSPSGVTINGGIMQGTGTIAANVTNSSGSLQASPDGAKPSTLTINGSYNQGVAGTLDEIIAGTSSGQFSVLDVTGTLTLGGTLNVTTANGFAFKAGQTFDIIDYPVGSLNGTFGTLAYNGSSGPGTSPLDISSSLGLAVNYSNGTPGMVQLIVTSISTTDIWNDNSAPCLASASPTCYWTDGNNDTTNWSLNVAPQQTTNMTTGVVSGANDVIIGGGPGGSVTLNTNTEVKSLTVEASDNTNPSTNYTLLMNGQYTLTNDKALTIGQGGEIDVTAKGAILTAGAAARNAGTLTLANGGSVTIGSAGSGGTSTNFTNYITPNQVNGNTGATVGGTINVDVTGTGGSTLTINGTLINENPSDKTTGTVNIGNAGITSNATLVAQDFGVAGTLDGTIKITGPSSGSAQAALSLTNSTGVTSIASTGSLTLSGKNTFVELSSQTGSNSALTNLATNSGKLELDNGAKVSTNAEYTQTSGTTTINGSGSQLQAIASNASGTVGVDIQSGSTLTVENHGDVCVGMQACQQSGATRDLTNEGTINIITSGTLSVSEDITNNTGATIDMDGTGNLTAGTGSVPGTGNVTNNGTFTVNGTLSNNGNVTNSGTLTVKGTAVTQGNVEQFSGQIAIDGNWDPVNFTQTGGSTVVNGTLVASTVDLQGGTLSGTGTITGTINLEGGTLSGNLTTSGNLVNSSTLIPNNGATPPIPGTMIVSGGYTQTSLGTIDELIAGTAATGEYGQLDILGGTANLDGTLDVLTDSFTDGFTFGKSDTYDAVLMANDGILGTFSTLEFDCPGPNCVMGNGTGPLAIDGDLFTLDLAYGANSIDLQVTQVPARLTPEPSSLLLLVIGLLGLAIARRKLKSPPLGV